jgi:Uncharacterised nucleotidyltransferase
VRSGYSLMLHGSLRPLDLLCACLSAGQEGRALDGASAGALVDPAADLVGLARLAGRHLVTPMLAACITDSQLSGRLPDDFTLYLEFIHDENTRRNRALRRQLGQVAASLNGIGIEPVLLKGAIRLVDGLYRDPGWRFMRDLDLLVARDRLSDAVARLGAIGYSFTDKAAGWPEQHKHLPPLACEGEAAVVEIHADLLPDWQELCPGEQVLARSRPVDLDGARVRVPETADQLAHLVGHDHLDGYLRRSGMFLLRSVFETALLCRDERSVPQFLARARGAGLAHCAQVRLDLAARFFPGYVSPAPDANLGERLKAGALIVMERFDESGRLRRLVWFGRLRLGKLLRSPAERKHIWANVLSPAYHRRSAERLRCLWTSH